MTSKNRVRIALVALLTLATSLVVVAPSQALNQCITTGHTSEGPYFAIIDAQGCPKVGYQARWNDYYGNLTYSAVYTKIPALSLTKYKTANIGGTYSNLKGRGCSVNNPGSVCTLGDWYSSVPWTNFP